MDNLIINLPRMYGDHHVTQVRQILLALPGVTDVYASSSFQVVEVRYDPAVLDAAAINATLDAAGYLQDMKMPAETGNPAYGSGQPDTFFRHTSAYTQTRSTISFTQHIPYEGRPLWPCPGMTPQEIHEGENDHG
ncbi:MAG: heavy-metal-associated domain-containing protein [Anaerolineae bacterium]|nr:heavy-metal-associated domain-containing protein [Anaerolineae bacterium]